MENSLKSKNFLQILKGVGVSLVVSLVGILVFAFVLRFVNIGDNLIKIINQVIKVLSVLLGVSLTLKKDKTKGLLKGAGVGALYTLLAYLVFSVLVGNFNFGLSLVFDTIFAAVIGLICGVIFVNVKTRG